MKPAESFLRFLSGIGVGSEAESYLSQFQRSARESFAAIVFDPATWRENADGVVLDLRLLATLALTPVVVLGFYEPARADAYAQTLHGKLAAMGISSASFASGAERAQIASAAARGDIPLLRLQGAEPEAREDELEALLRQLGTHKLIFLRNEGGLSHKGQRLSVVNLSDEFDELMASSELSDDQKRLLRCSRRLVLALGTSELLVTVTSPLSLLHELFTVKGAGTLLRRGARILRYEDPLAVDRAALVRLLEDSFGKTLRRDALDQSFASLYIEERYRGAALVKDTPLGSYLSKFAVTRQAQGEGIGRDLWQAMRADHARLFWRARRDNAVRSFYERQCDGRIRAGEWNVYSIGIEAEHFADVVRYALAQPVDF